MYLSTLAAAVWQQDSLSGGTTRLLMIFIGIAAFALLSQAVVMLGMAIGAAKAQKTIMAQIETINGKLLPLLDKSNILVADLTPQIKDIAAKAQSISDNVHEISSFMVVKVNEFGPTITAANETIMEANNTVQDANRKTQAQVNRVNEMVSDVLNATAQMGRAVQHGIEVPVREVSGIVEGIKAGLLTFINGGRR